MMHLKKLSAKEDSFYAKSEISTDQPRRENVVFILSGVREVCLVLKYFSAISIRELLSRELESMGITFSLAQIHLP